MSRTRTRALAALLVACSVCGGALSGEVVSTMRNVNAVAEAHGFRINPAFDMVGARGPDEMGDPQAFEILRPLDQGVTLGRIYTSCTCIQLVAPKRAFAPGERAVLHLRNVKETPVNGQIYAIYVQISNPIRTTLRFDTFVQSNSLINPGPEEAEAGAEAGENGTDAETDAAAADGGADADDAEVEVEVAAANAAPNAAPGADGLTAEELPEMPGIEIIVPGGAAATAEAGEAATAAAEDAAAAAEAEVAAANAALAAAREELAAIMSTRSEDLTAPSPTTAAVREEIDSFFAADPGAARTAAPSAVASAAGMEGAGWQVVASAPAAAPAAAQAPVTTAAASPATRSAAAGAAAGGSVRAVSLITLGVQDMARSASFYEAVGWQRAARSKYDAAAFFQLHGQVLALYPIADMLREQGMADARPAPGGISLALHVATPEEVATEFDRFVAAGGVALKEPAAGPGGAVTGYVADPDGNPWEISCVPQFVLDGEGGLWLR